MRATFYEYRIREKDGVAVYQEVEAVREGEPGNMVLVEDRETDITFPLSERKRAIAEMNRKNRERREAEKGQP